jgi:hypothetical protein
MRLHSRRQLFANAVMARGDENLRADSIGPMLLGHPHAKSEPFAPNFDVTLSVSTVPLPLSTLTVAGIVRGAPASPKLSYASERTTVVNLTAPESSGGVWLRLADNYDDFILPAAIEQPRPVSAAATADSAQKLRKLKPPQNRGIRYPTQALTPVRGR